MSDGAHDAKDNPTSNAKREHNCAYDHPEKIPQDLPALASDHQCKKGGGCKSDREGGNQSQQNALEKEAERQLPRYNGGTDCNPKKRRPKISVQYNNLLIIQVLDKHHKKQRYNQQHDANYKLYQSYPLGIILVPLTRLERLVKAVDQRIAFSKENEVTEQGKG